MKYKRFVQFIDGTWRFTSPTNLKVIIDGVPYYEIQTKFGLSTIDNTNQYNPNLVGSPGDYVTRSSDGSYKYISKEKYDKLFPQKATTAEKFKPLNSDSLR